MLVFLTLIVAVMVGFLIAKVQQLMGTFDSLVAEVTALDSAVDSAALAFTALENRLTAALSSSDITAAVTEIRDHLSATKNKLAAAVAHATAAADDSDVIGDNGDPIGGNGDGATDPTAGGAATPMPTTTGHDMSTMTREQPADPSGGAPDGNVRTDSEGAGLNPRPDETSNVVGDPVDPTK